MMRRCLVMALGVLVVGIAPRECAAGDEPARAPEQLVADLKGPRPDLAAAALGRLGDPAAVKAMLPLAEAGDGELRATVAWALGRCGDSAATPALVKLAGDPHPPARAAALWALGRIGGPAAADPLREGLRDPNRNVRLAATRGIAAGGHKDLFAILTPRLEYEVREVPAEDEHRPPDAPPELVEKVFWVEPDAAVRLATVQTLGRLGVADALPALIFALQRETSFNRAALIGAIESFGPDAAGVCLGRIVPTPYDAEAFEKRMPLLITNGTLAVIAGRLGDRRCVPHLLKTLTLPRKGLGEDKDLTELYIHTVALLGRFRVAESAGALAAMLRETRVAQLSEALEASLRAIGRPAAGPLARNAGEWELAPVFLSLLREPDLRTRDARETLVEFLSNESDEVRREAVETLGLYIHEGVLDLYDIPLLTAMHLDPDRSVRQICAKWRDRIAEKFGQESVQ